MKKLLLYLTPLVLPFVLMILINETYTPKNTNKEQHKHLGYLTQNSGRPLEECSWACHNTSVWCAQNHTTKSDLAVKLMKPIYVGMIRGLHFTGDYEAANVAFLVILWPVFMYLMLVKIISNYRKIRKLKQQSNTL